MGLFVILAIIVITLAIGIGADYGAKRLAYGREDYAALAAKMERAQKRIDEMKSRPGSGDRGNRIARDIAHMERALLEDRQLFGGITLRAMLCTTAGSLLAFWLLRMLFGGVVVATLPFEPIAWFRYMTHQSLEGDDYRQASYLFIFVCTNMAIKPLLVKHLGLEPPKAAQAAADWSKIFTTANEMASRQ